MPFYYDLNQAVTTNGSAGTENTMMFGKTVANQKRFRWSVSISLLVSVLPVVVKPASRPIPDQLQWAEAFRPTAS